MVEYIKEKAAEAERQRQRALEKAREMEREKAVEEERMQNELRQRKKMEKERKREEVARQKEEEELRKREEEEEEGESTTGDEDGGDEPLRTDKPGKANRCVACLVLLTLVLGLLLIVATLVLSQCPGGAQQCPRVVEFFKSTGIYDYIM